MKTWFNEDVNQSWSFIQSFLLMRPPSLKTPCNIKTFLNFRSWAITDYKISLWYINYSTGKYKPCWLPREAGDWYISSFLKAICPHLQNKSLKKYESSLFSPKYFSNLIFQYVTLCHSIINKKYWYLHVFLLQ